MATRKMRYSTMMMTATTTLITMMTITRSKPRRESTRRRSITASTRRTKSGYDSSDVHLLGPWGERFQVTHVSPSIVPNFFPTLRVMEYNISGLDLTATWASGQASDQAQEMDWLEEVFDPPIEYADDDIEDGGDADNDEESISKKKKKHKKPKNPKNPDLIVPSPPAKSSPPGPAYSPQPLTLLGYTQYFANLTYINHDSYVGNEEAEADKWHEGKHKGKHPKDKVPHLKPFKFQVEYDTFTDPVYKLKDLTVRSYIKLAHRIGQYKPRKGDRIDGSSDSKSSRRATRK